MGRVCRTAPLAAALLAGLLAAGCGGPARVLVEGQATVSGEPLKLTPKDQMSVAYVAEQDRTVLFSALVAPDGKFKVSDHTGQGIPPGKYKVVVQLGVNGPGGGGDRFRDAYSLAKTPLRHDVSAENATISLDLKAPAGK